MKNWIIGAVLVLAAAAAWYFFTVYQPAKTDLAATAPVEIAEPVIEPAVIPEEPEPDEAAGTVFVPVSPPETEEIPLPMLGESDPVVLESLGELMGEPAVTQYIVSDNVISRVVATIDTMGSRKIPGVVQAVHGPESSFAATLNDDPETIINNEEGDEIPQFFIDPSNYDRYTPYVDLLESMDSAQLVESYRSNYPLFQEAFRQMGYPEGDFDGRLIEIIDELLATPELTEPVDLVKPEAYFLFADPGLESRSAGQKILLRMGNENAARVKLKLTEVRALLSD